MNEKEKQELSSGAEKVENIERAAEQERMAAERRVAEARARMNEEKEKARKQNTQEGGREKSNPEPQKQSGNKRGKKRGDGLGGWIAAVTSLGAVTLILTAVVTVGAIRMSQDNASVAGGYRGTVYEFIHLIEEIDDDLDALRICESPSKQAELLTDILVQTRMAEMGLEKLPFETKHDEKTMRFLNGISEFCERSLGKLARGESLSEWDKNQIEGIYQSQHKIRGKLDELASCCEDKDITGMMKGKKSCINETLQSIENELTTNPLVGEKQPRKPDGEMPTPPAPNGNTPTPPAPKGDMPILPIPNGDMPMPNGSMPNLDFSTPSGEMLMPAQKGKKERVGITSQKAEELCRYYFSDYKITDAVYGGESLGKGLKAYNFTLTTEDGVELFAEISQADGSLIYFDYYKECNRHVYDVETAKGLAQDFLTKFGYENMVPVRVDESGTNADFTFVYSMDGCTYYPDAIVVKVCEERGLVVGLNASKYLKNHRDRYALNEKITMQEARDNLSDKLTVEASETVLFEHKGREVLAYEFFCSYDGKLYFIYVDAMDGRELYIVNATKGK